MSYRYKNVSGQETALIGVGLVPIDGEIVVDRAIENPNFQYLGEAAQETPVEPEPQPQPEETN